MEKTCGNCGHAKVCAVFISSETGCCQWSPCVDTLKQRYQQLAAVARELYKDLERVSDKRLERSKRENMLETHFNKLYDLGVEL